MDLKINEESGFFTVKNPDPIWMGGKGGNLFSRILRYSRLDLKKSVGACCMRSLPTLDLRLWSREPARFARELRSAMHTVGFFRLRHGGGSVCADALRSAASFFALESAEKAAIDYRRSPAFRGYMPLGVENTAGQTDMREQIEFAAEGAPAAAGAWPPYRRLIGPNQWPSAAPHLRPSLLALTSHLSAVSAELCGAICAALALPPAALAPLFTGEPHWQLKIARCVAAPPPAMGVGAHSDSGFLTLLLQDQVGGLQVDIYIYMILFLNLCDVCSH